MDALGFLPKYNGLAVHDGFASYNKYGCEHALCNVHLKRELTGIERTFEAVISVYESQALDPHVNRERFREEWLE